VLPDFFIGAHWRLLPLTILVYFLCYLDRINVGFAALTMNKDLGLDAATYGMAAGAFFWGYFLFEVPSNIILEKLGARIWIARIMVTWGLLSGATAFSVGPWSFLTMRFLLGLAEAGLFPGMILFFTYWFPDWHRARIVSGFMVALTLETERRLVEAKRKVSLWESFWNPKVLWLTLSYFGIVTASVGMLLFLPQIIKQLGLTNMQVGWVTMIPYLCAVIAMLAWGWVSDRLGERRWTLSLACLISAAGLVIAAQTDGTVWALVGISIAAMGFYGSKGPFWSIPSMILTGTAAASGIAWINSVGNLGGFFGPTMVGWAKDYTGSFAGGLYALAGFALMSAVISALWLRIPNPMRQEMASVPAE